MMRNTKITKSVLVALLLQFFFVTETQANAISLQLVTDVDVQLNITTPTEDFIIQNQRQYAENIARMDERLAAFKFTFESELKTIITQRDLLLVKMNQVDQKLYPVRFLNDLNKHCAQKYEGKIPTAKSVNSSITACETTALRQYFNIVNPPTTTRNSMNTYYFGVSGTLVTNLGNCKKNHPNLESQNYTECVSKAITSADSNTAAYVKRFNNEMETAHCDAEDRVRTAIDCSFTIVYNTASTMGETIRLIDNCSLGSEICAPCDPPKPTFNCPNQLSVSLNASDYRNPTLKNPFYGITGKINCVLLHLGEPSWS